MIATYSKSSRKGFKMTKLVILTQTERRRFDSPPIFNANERALYFSLNKSMSEMMLGIVTAA